MKRISSFLLEQINYIFLFLTMLTFWGAIRSSNFNLEGISSKFVVLLSLFVLTAMIIFFHSTMKDRSIRLINIFFDFFKRNSLLITIIIFVLMVISQVFILVNVTTPIGWDVGAIVSGVRNPQIMNDYLSYYPNNQLYYFLMYLYNEVISTLLPELKGHWLIFQMLNIAFIDTAAVVLYKAAKEMVGKKGAYVTLYLYMFLFMLSPWIMVPYTDQISLWLTCIVLYLYSNLKNITGAIFYLAILMIGIFAGVSFLIKPSSIIYIVAWSIVMSLKMIVESRFSFQSIIIVILISISFYLPFAGFNQFMKNQEIVKIDSSKAMPWTHFVMMGLSGSGGYSSTDVERDMRIVDPDLRKKSNIEVIEQRLSEHRISGYVKFLIQKHFNNTDRGDFGWGRDGTPQNPEENSKNSVQSFLRDMYYQQGKKTNVVRFSMQIVWIVIIIGLIYSFKSEKNDYVLYCMKLTIIGAFLYLLLFEGGRSRYLIQYLPFFLIVSSIGLAKCLDFFRELKHPQTKE